MRPSGCPIKAWLVDGKLLGGMVASLAANFAVAGEETCTPKRMDIRYLINLKPAIGYQFNGYSRKCQLLKGIFPYGFFQLLPVYPRDGDPNYPK